MGENEESCYGCVDNKSKRPNSSLLPQDQFYKHIKLANPLKDVSFLRDITTTVPTVTVATAAETICDRVKIVVEIGTYPVIVHDSKTAISIPNTLCNNNFVQHNAYYLRDFLLHFRNRECNFRPKPYYLKYQHEIDHADRAILVNWIVSVINENNFNTETLYLAISYIDRFLSQKVLTKARLQLVGITAVFVAAKYEETRPPGVQKFASIGGNKFDTKQIVKMERLLLTTLTFDLNAPTSYTFAIAYASITDTPHLLRFLTIFICELTLLEAEPYLQFLPSLISAASHALARYLLGYPIWSKRLEDLTLYRLEDLKKILLFLCKTHFRATKLFNGATRTKFLQEKYHQVALIEPIYLDDDSFEQVVHNYNSFK